MVVKETLFTWSNKRLRADHVKAHLDKVIYYVEWRDLFPYAQVVNGNMVGSDYRPLIVVLHQKEEDKAISV